LHDHEPSIIHGDVRGGNVLISDQGIPCLTDFGLSRILGDTVGITTSSSTTGSLRWMSRELLENEKVNEQSDVWAFGMTVIVCTSKLKLASRQIQRFYRKYLLRSGHIQKSPSILP
ncbi:kinase-like domain-containing protein, partial [Hysterangium stoloniferum]